MKKKPSGRKLPPARQKELLGILKDRFEKNAVRHSGLHWEAVQARLEANVEKLWSLNEMGRQERLLRPRGAQGHARSTSPKTARPAWRPRWASSCSPRSSTGSCSSAAIAAAKAAGAQRIVYTSHMGANPRSLFPPMPSHAQTEELLAASGVPFVSLRNGFYTSALERFVGPALETGQLIAPEDGPVSWTTHADLAEAAAVALVEADRFTGATPPLTAGAAHDLAGVARIASERVGRPIERVVVDDESYRATMLARHTPAFQIEMTLGLFRASRNREFAAVAPTLGDLLGRAPISVRDFLARAG